jgi:hypothetical protein
VPGLALIEKGRFPEAAAALQWALRLPDSWPDIRLALQALYTKGSQTFYPNMRREVNAFVQSKAKEDGFNLDQAAIDRLSQDTLALQQVLRCAKHSLRSAAACAIGCEISCSSRCLSFLTVQPKVMSCPSLLESLAQCDSASMGSFCTEMLRTYHQRYRDRNACEHDVVDLFVREPNRLPLIAQEIDQHLRPLQHHAGNPDIALKLLGTMFDLVALNVLTEANLVDDAAVASMPDRLKTARALFSKCLRSMERDCDTIVDLVWHILRYLQLIFSHLDLLPVILASRVHLEKLFGKSLVDFSLDSYVHESWACAQRELAIRELNQVELSDARISEYLRLIESAAPVNEEKGESETVLLAYTALSKCTEGVARLFRSASSLERLEKLCTISAPMTFWVMCGIVANILAAFPHQSDRIHVRHPLYKVLKRIFQRVAQPRAKSADASVREHPEVARLIENVALCGLGGDLARAS